MVSISEDGDDQPSKDAMRRRHLPSRIMIRRIFSLRCNLAVTSFTAAMILTQANAFGQESVNVPAPEVLKPAVTAVPASTTNERVMMQQIDEMIRAGIDEEIMIDMIRERGFARPLTVNDLVMLRQKGMTNNMIRELQQAAPKTTPYPSPAAVQTAPVTPVRVYEPAPAPVIIQTVPRYYVPPVPHVYYHRPHHYHHRYVHPHHSSSISFGFHF